MKKILLFISLFFWFFLDTSAFNAHLSVSSNNLNINDNLYLRIEVSDSINFKDIKLENIEWIKNFEIISTSHSQSFSSKYTLINWKLKKNSKQIYYIDIVLKPRKNWKIVLWPAEISSLDIIKKTNVEKISVVWKKIIEKEDDYFWNRDFGYKKINNENLWKYNILKFIIVFALTTIIVLIIIFSRNNNKDNNK